MWTTYYAPSALPEALALIERHGDACRIMAGGTDLILEMERGARRQQVVVDVSRVQGIDGIALEDGRLALGALVTHGQAAASPDVMRHAFPLARACWLVGAPQIRGRGTIAGNLVTASPANDTITPLWALDATLTLTSKARGSRTVTMPEFFLGVRRTALAPDEMLTHIDVPIRQRNERGTFLKLGLRQAQAISVVNVAVVIAFAGEPGPETPVARARVALGSVAPTIVRAAEAEAFLVGKTLSEETIRRAGALVASAARPISDVRGSAEYRRDMVDVLSARALRQLRDGVERQGYPEQPLQLRRRGSNGRDRSPDIKAPALGTAPISSQDPIRFTLNGRPVVLEGAGGKTLLRALREDAGLTGTKEGCAEGECGACTVWLDGVAVMSCLVPAERATGCEVVTVEGLGNEEHLHPVQQAFIDKGAVQCGYCTPGFLMSAAMLLEESPQPTREQVKEALTGNLCRCTGYYRIVEAVERAATLAGASGHEQ